MKILQAHKYYYPRDGASKYMLELSGLLTNDGHEVMSFSMQNPENLPSECGSFFVTNLDLSGQTSLSLFKKIQAVGRIFYSTEAKKKISQLLEVTKPDVVHLHNIYHHISPSILPVIKKHGIPVVMTLHDYKLLSPNYSLFHHGAIHEEDAKGWYTTCIGNKCVKDSRAKSLISTAEMIFHHKIMKYYERYVDRFIAPSQFMIDLCVKHGWDRSKFVHIPHPVESNAVTPLSSVSYVLYHGRLSEEKGLTTLLDAAKRTPRVSYRIAGTGPLEQVLRDRITNEAIHNVQLLGFQSGNALEETVRGASIVVVPSVWYENYPLSILEAKAAGKVVIGSKIGGIPEMLSDALLVSPGNALALAQKIETWYGKPMTDFERMGMVLRQDVAKYNDSKKHVRAIEEVYQSLLKVG